MSYKSELAARLEELPGLVLSSVHVGIEEVVIPAKDWYEENRFLQDNWTITVSYEGKSYSSKYSAGIGNRKLIRSAKKEGNRYKTEKEACQAQWLKLIPPTIDDVMSCLLSDGRCAEGTFEDFCGELGYDSDSRKALAVYLACQEARNGLIKMLGSELFNELSQLEH
jgi:hypothetical protein